MNLLSEIKAAVTGCGLSVETGVFSGEPPEEYVVVTPLADTYELHADITSVGGQGTVVCQGVV